MTRISEAFDLIAQWTVAVNGHDEPRRSVAGAAVPSFHAYIEFNGLPAGLISPMGGTIVASSPANEDAFIEALRGAIERAQKAALSS